MLCYFDFERRQTIANCHIVLQNIDGSLFSYKIFSNLILNVNDAFFLILNSLEGMSLKPV